MVADYTARFGKGKVNIGFSRVMLDNAMNYHETVKMRKIESRKYEKNKHMSIQ